MEIRNAAMYVLNLENGTYVFPEEELDVTLEAVQVYLEQRTMKMLGDQSKQQAQFRKDSGIPPLLAQLTDGSLSFLAAAKLLADKIWEGYQDMEDPLNMDVLLYLFTDGEGEEEQVYLAVVQLAHKAVLTHVIKDDGKAVALGKFSYALPNVSQPVYGYAYMPLAGGTAYLKAKAVKINGESVEVLKEDVLGVETDLSPKQVITAVNRCIDKVASQFQKNNAEACAVFKQSLLQCAEENSPLQLEETVSQIFTGTAAGELQTALETASVAKEVVLQPEFAQKSGDTMSIKTDNGIKLTFPTSYFDHEVRVKEQRPGEFSITISGITEMTCK